MKYHWTNPEDIPKDLPPGEYNVRMEGVDDTGIIYVRFIGGKVAETETPNLSLPMSMIFPMRTWIKIRNSLEGNEIIFDLSEVVDAITDSLNSKGVRVR